MTPSPRLLFLTLAAAPLAVLALTASPSFAQNAHRVADREIARRQAALPQGTEAIARGQTALAAKDYGRAHEEFRVAVGYLPDAVVSGKPHDEAVAGFCESGIKLAKIGVQEGKYNEAEAICRELL